MSTLLKDLYSPQFYKHFSRQASEVIPHFNPRKFVQKIFDAEWEKKELKTRMKHTSSVLHEFLPQDFRKAAMLICDIIANLRKQGLKESGIEYMFFPDYVETFGLHDFDTSVEAFEYITTFTSCEFAVRPFIIQYGDDMLKRMLGWSLHENHHVRRLASEGSRPRLPWAMAIPALKKNPKPVLPILENLKCDTSEYVRRSVANNLNDISKDHPDLVISIAKLWKGLGKETDGIIKHGCRTLLKQSHPAILKYYKLNTSESILVQDFSIMTPKVKIGHDLKFSFRLFNNTNKAQMVRIEYAVYYLRQNGRLSKKVFKISERELKGKVEMAFNKKQSFRIITTRKFYKGQQQLSIIVNGKESMVKAFELI